MSLRVAVAALEARLRFLRLLFFHNCSVGGKREAYLLFVLRLICELCRSGGTAALG